MPVIIIMRTKYHLLFIVLVAIAALWGGILSCSGHLLSLSDSHMHSVAFYFEGQAESVCVAGDFNQWIPDSHCLKRRRDHWSIRVPLPHGPTHYVFIVNGKQWVMDPNALYVENDGFGQTNSVVMVE